MELKFPLPIKGISEFEKRNGISINVLGVDTIVNVLGIEENKAYLIRRSKYESGKKVVNLFLIAKGEVNEPGKAVDWRHYTAIKSLSIGYLHLVTVDMDISSISV